MWNKTKPVTSNNRTRVNNHIVSHNSFCKKSDIGMNMAIIPKDDPGAHNHPGSNTAVVPHDAPSVNNNRRTYPSILTHFNTWVNYR